MKPRRSLAWGILGTGRIAHAFAGAVREGTSGHLAAVGSRTVESGRTFAREFGIPRAFGGYEDVLACPEVEAVYISLPNHLHAEWTMRCAAAGKHILCEKPFAVNRPEAERAIEAVKKAGVFCMEAFMYRLHPQTARLIEVVRSGDIGEVRLVQATFCFDLGSSRANDVRLGNALAGGGIMDVGCYPVSAARLIAGAARGNPFLNPTEVRGAATIGSVSGVDEWAGATMKFPGGCVASVACGIRVQTDNTLRIWGSKGHIIVPVPWKPPSEHARLLVQREGETAPTEILVDAPGSLYAIEVDAVAQHVFGGDREAVAPGMTWADTLGNMAALDAWRADIGLSFACERR